MVSFRNVKNLTEFKPEAGIEFKPEMEGEFGNRLDGDGSDTVVESCRRQE